jgi:hypothetical protein
MIADKRTIEMFTVSPERTTREEFTIRQRRIAPACAARRRYRDHR